MKLEFFKITRVVKKFDRSTRSFRISISYKTSAPITPRTLTVAEAFGLGVDESRSHVLYDNVELRICPKDIVYITGESGSGKSILLKHLEKLVKLDKSQKMALMAILGQIRHPRLRRTLGNQPYRNAKDYRLALENASLHKLATTLRVLNVLTQKKIYLFCTLS